MLLSTYDYYVMFTMALLLCVYTTVVAVVMSKLIAGRLTNWKHYPLIPNFVQRMVHNLWFKVLRESVIDAKLLLILTPIAIIIISLCWIITLPALVYCIIKYTTPYIINDSDSTSE